MRRILPSNWVKSCEFPPTPHPTTPCQSLAWTPRSPQNGAPGAHCTPACPLSYTGDIKPPLLHPSEAVDPHPHRGLFSQMDCVLQARSASSTPAVSRTPVLATRHRSSRGGASDHGWDDDEDYPHGSFVPDDVVEAKEMLAKLPKSALKARQSLSLSPASLINARKQYSWHYSEPLSFLTPATASQHCSEHL